jgi:hypothetical protein
MASGVVLIVSVEALAITAKELVPSSEALTSAIEALTVGTVVAESSGCFFVFLPPSTSLRLEYFP